jgi:hypothetical protein
MDFRSKLIACGHWFLKSKTGRRIYKWARRRDAEARKARAQRMKNNPETAKQKTKTPG